MWIELPEQSPFGATERNIREQMLLLLKFRFKTKFRLQSLKSKVSERWCVSNTKRLQTVAQPTKRPRKWPKEWKRSHTESADHKIYI